MLKKLFIIENDPFLQDALQMFFTEAGIEIDIQSDATALLDGTASHPDVILINHCREFDGLQACQQVQQKPALNHIPVVVMSVYENIKLSAMQAGAVAFIEMPFNVINLQAILEQWAITPQ